MNSLSITLPDGASRNFYSPAGNNPGQPVFLDSGGTLTRLPTVMFQALAETFPTAQLDEPSGYYVVDCAVANQAGSIDFGFGNKIIRVAFKDFIWHVPDTPFCVLGAVAGDGT